MKIFNWLKRLFSVKKPAPPVIAPPVVTKEETPAVQMAATPGIKCPDCGNRIVVSIQQLTSYQPISCGFCGLELEIDADKSAQSIAALTRLEKTLADAACQRKDALTS